MVNGAKSNWWQVTEVIPKASSGASIISLLTNWMWGLGALSVNSQVTSSWVGVLVGPRGGRTYRKTWKKSISAALRTAAAGSIRVSGAGAG